MEGDDFDLRRPKDLWPKDFLILFGLTSMEDLHKRYLQPVLLMLKFSMIENYKKAISD